MRTVFLNPKEKAKQRIFSPFLRWRAGDGAVLGTVVHQQHQRSELMPACV